MFEYITLRNFKSIPEIHFDLRTRNGKPKNLILIYGENGIGKSNLASAFFLLSNTLRTMDLRDFLYSILESNKFKEDKELNHLITQHYNDIETLIKDNKMILSTEPMYLEFGFQLNGKSGKYILEMDDIQIIHESLEYTLLHNKGIYFDISPHTISINPKIFQDKSSYLQIQDSCQKFWGKHSFLSIILHEITDKSDIFIKEQLIPNFHIILNFFKTLSCKIKFGNSNEQGILGLPSSILSNFQYGRILNNDIDQLNKAEYMLNLFFQLTCPNIESLQYTRDVQEEYTHYRLMVLKNIAGKKRSLDFSLESTGTQSILELLPFMLIGVYGSTVIIDEFDTGIHDLLVEKIISSLHAHLTGQLIITTHNTYLMESKKIPKECIYVMNHITEKTKEVQCITAYDPKIHKNTNIRNQYMNGKYNGIPQKLDQEINFRTLLNSLIEKKS